MNAATAGSRCWISSRSSSSTGGYIATDDFLQFIRNAESGVKEPGLFEGRGPLAILLLVLLGGLALNLTPCVLPMIPINLAIIGAGAGSGSRSRGFVLGGVYGAAMALVYGVLGVIVILTAGTFGTINASPWFNVAIAVIFVALALAMFDVFEIDFSRFSGSIGADPSKRGSVARGVRHGRRGRAARRRVRRAGRHPGRVVLERSLRARNRRGPGAAVPARHRDGMPVAAGRRRPDRAAEARRLDGPGEAGLRRLDPRDRCLLRLSRLTACSPIAGSMRKRWRRASRRNSRPAGMRRSPKASPSRSGNRSRCSWTCGRRGARTAW